jgi:lysine 2,3-aminomutase
MSVRISPYLLSLIDWCDPYDDPLRIQFVPVASRMLPDHPKLQFDPLNEQLDSLAPGLTHRYPNKALFLALNSCPVYCRFCTRSYAVGGDTQQIKKVRFNVIQKQWAPTFDYIRSHPEIEDVVVSGGDLFNLRAEHLTTIGMTLLNMEHVRRVRFATKGLAVMPQRILTDTAWTDALTRVAEYGRHMHKEVALHTHFNHAREITSITRDAMDLLFERAIVVRNQSVLLRAVNDTPEEMSTLIKRLGYINVQPYYIYMHDLVRGAEDLRTSLTTGIDLEKQIRGVTAGFHTPTVIVDTPGGGGKRDVHSYEHYDRETGISVYTAPAVKEGYFLYCDPIDTLPEESQRCWQVPAMQEKMIHEALRAARMANSKPGASHKF